MNGVLRGAVTVARLPWVGITILSLLWVTSSAQEALPKDVQAELLQRQIVAAYQQQDTPDVLRLIAKLRGVVGKIPPALSYLEATESAAAGDAVRAHAALSEFLRDSPREGARYEQALKLYPDYERAANGIRQLQAQAAMAQKQADLWSRYLSPECRRLSGLYSNALAAEVQAIGSASERQQKRLTQATAAADAAYRSQGCPQGEELDNAYDPRAQHQ